MSLLYSTQQTADPAPRAVSRDWGRALLGIVLIGSVCRLAQYLADPSYWHDEALVVMNVMDKTAAQLLLKLDYSQAAPPLFLLAERGLFRLFGASEYALRLPSLLCGLSALPLFALLCWRIFPGAIAFCVAAFFAFSDKLIWHSAEVKPYSGDLFGAVLLLYLALAFRTRDSTAECDDQSEFAQNRSRSRGLPASLRASNAIRPTHRLVMLAVVAAALVWFSFPAAIVFGGLSLMLLPEISRREPRDVAIYVAANAVVVTSFLLLYRYSIKPQHSAYLSAFWARDFPPYDRPATIPIWLASEIYALCDHPYRSFGVIILLLAMAGIAGFARARRGKLLAACLLPIVLAVTAACFRQYPFNGDRVTIYLVPGLFLLCGGGLMFLRNRLASAAVPLRMVWMVVAGVVIGRGAIEATNRLAEPRSRSGVRPVVAYLREHRRAGEGIYLIGELPDPKTGQFDSKLCLESLCYWHAPPPPVHRGLSVGRTGIAERKFWVIFACLPQTASTASARLLKQLHPVATEITRFTANDGGGAALLFEKTDAGLTTKALQDQQPRIKADERGPEK